MNLTDYPTPETEAILKAIVLTHNPETDYERGLELMGCAMANVESLERRLAACREALDGVNVACFRIGRGDVGDIGFAVSTMRQKANAALSLTSPLAELKP